MKPEELLNKYFEGETSCEEENILRDYFRSDHLPAHLEMYKPLFAYFDAEAKAALIPPVRKKTNRAVIFYLSGIAASVIILLGITFTNKRVDPCLCESNYVVINGRCYTDTDIVLSHAFGALQEVAASAGEYLPFAENREHEKKIIENQLKELGTIFSDDE